jgi:sugar phosphate isomerase/epimerase
MKFGLCTPAENIPALHKLGYDFIELRGIDIRKADWQKIRDIAAMAERFAIPCSGFNAYCGKDLPIVGPDFDPAAVRAYAQDVCEKGAMLKIKTVGIGSPRAGCLPDGFPADEADRQMEEFLVITAQEAAKYGQFVLLESPNTKICNYLTATPDALAMVRRMALPNLAIVLDFYHMNVMSEDVTQIAEYMPFVRHLHISGLSRAGVRTFLRAEELNFSRSCLQARRNRGTTGPKCRAGAGVYRGACRPARFAILKKRCRNSSTRRAACRPGLCFIKNPLCLRVWAGGGGLCLFLSLPL